MQKPGGAAALLKAAAAAANLIIIFAVLGPAVAIAPRSAIGGAAALVAANAAPLVALELLKIVSAACLLVIVLAVRERMLAVNAANVRWAMLAGFAGAVLLTLGGLVGLFAIAQAGRAGGTPDALAAYEDVSGTVTYIGLFALLAVGIWCLLTAGAAIRRGGLSLRLAYFTFLYGALNVLAFFLPPLSLLVTVVELLWACWLGLFLLRKDTLLRANI
jgi:hypothetical protein